ncbi:MAG TPA: hypothetical protein VGM75_19590 [Pseudonocardiaceae bacterium]
MTVVTRSAGNPPTLRLEYVSEPRRGRCTVVEFEGVSWYAWTDESFEFFNENSDDFEFGLIEITNSERIQRWANSAPGRGLPWALKESDLHHYRLGFEDHGTYDVICAEMNVNVGPCE